MPASGFEEAKGSPGTARPIRDLGLTIEGTPLAAVLDEFGGELDRAGICPLLRPRFYLSTEWGVPFGTIAIAIPFYLARPELTALHAERTGFVEGVGRADLLRYLRHEMGHVVNYAYRLYEREDWVEAFGPITRPYREEYRPEPFSRRYVRHLPGWYAQKHPDEDWAETFAVWMTPGRDWRAEYAGWPEALGKLELCGRLMAELADCRPPVTADDLDEDVGEIAATLEEFYGGEAHEGAERELPPGLDGALRAIFEDLGAARGIARGGSPPAGGGSDPAAGARAAGRGVPLDRPLPGAHPGAAAWDGDAGRGAGAGLPGGPRGGGGAGDYGAGDGSCRQLRSPRAVRALTPARAETSSAPTQTTTTIYLFDVGAELVSARVGGLTACRSPGARAPGRRSF